jgi:hypothetical protein
MNFARLLRYDVWANTETLASVRRTPSRQAVRWMAHILGAEFVWLGRLTDTPSPLEVWPELDADACEIRLDELARVWPSYLAEVGGQIAAAVRSEGGSPAYTDFIHAARQGLID